MEGAREKGSGTRESGNKRCRGKGGKEVENQGGNDEVSRFIAMMRRWMKREKKAKRKEKSSAHEAKAASDALSSSSNDVAFRFLWKSYISEAATIDFQESESEA